MAVLANTMTIKAARLLEAAAFHAGAFTSGCETAAPNNASQRPRQNPVQGRGTMLPRQRGGAVFVDMIASGISQGFICEVRQ